VGECYEIIEHPDFKLVWVDEMGKHDWSVTLEYDPDEDRYSLYYQSGKLVFDEMPAEFMENLADILLKAAKSLKPADPGIPHAFRGRDVD